MITVDAAITIITLENKYNFHDICIYMFLHECKKTFCWFTVFTCDLKYCNVYDFTYRVSLPQFLRNHFLALKRGYLYKT